MDRAGTCRSTHDCRHLEKGRERRGELAEVVIAAQKILKEACPIVSMLLENAPVVVNRGQGLSTYLAFLVTRRDLNLYVSRGKPLPM